MISTNDIKKAVVTALLSDAYRVFDEPVSEPQLAHGPIVIVTVNPLTSAAARAARMEERTYLVECAWMNAAVPANAAMYDAADDMAARLTPVLRIGTRRVMPQNIQYDMADGVARVIFELNFLEERRTVANRNVGFGFDEDGRETMGILDI